MSEILKKTIYVSKEEEEKIMKGVNMSFTLRIKSLVSTALNVEKILDKIVDDIIFDEEYKGDVYDRLKELINEGYEYEKVWNTKVTLEQALGYFNRQYKKKHPDNDLPILK